MNKLNILVGTPAYGCMVHIDYFQSMIALCRGCERSGINVEFATIGNNSLVPKARNSLISYFIQHDQFSHLLFVDADIGIPNDCVPKLIRRNVDIIGVPVPLKGFDEHGFPVLNVGKIFNADKSNLAEVEHIGSAVLMISKNAALKICKSSKVYEDDSRYTRGQFLCKKNYDVFKIGALEDNTYISEDYYFCHKARSLDFKIYADYSIPVVHNGSFGFATSTDLLNKIIGEHKNGTK